MQEALPYKRWESLPPPTSTTTAAAAPPSTTTISGDGDGGEERILLTMESLVNENPLIVLGKRGCCMCHVVRKLLLGLGVNPPVFEIDSDVNDSVLVNSLLKIVKANGNNNRRKKKLLVGGERESVENVQFPVVFVGGELFGGLDKVIATHLSGDLVPILKQAGALWL